VSIGAAARTQTGDRSKPMMTGNDGRGIGWVSTGDCTAR